MREAAEVAYRETQYGVRNSDGEIRPRHIGPNEAESIQAAGFEVFRRDHTVYVDHTTDWRALPATEAAER